jgi:hypothetical protein
MLQIWASIFIAFAFLEIVEVGFRPLHCGSRCVVFPTFPDALMIGLKVKMFVSRGNWTDDGGLIHTLANIDPPSCRNARLNPQATSPMSSNVIRQSSLPVTCHRPVSDHRLLPNHTFGSINIPILLNVF